ncbi:putative calcium-binding protein CML13 [Apium graveolens]|uniref:putative calcium-binding protein CML13 n=1 Tax=Apium graveolens TaxID=4045 RepID=UPI003D7AB495
MASIISDPSSLSYDMSLWNRKRDKLPTIIFNVNLGSYILLVSQIHQMIVDVDNDDNGAIDFDEFLYMIIAKIGERDSKDGLMKAFQVIDQYKNGKISAADIQRIAKDLEEQFTNRDIQEIVDEDDQDRDGEVNFEEFMRMMKRTTYG